MLKQCTSPSMNLKFKSTLLKSETHEKKRALSVDRAHVYSFCYVCYIVYTCDFIGLLRHIGMKRDLHYRRNRV